MSVNVHSSTIATAKGWKRPKGLPADGQIKRKVVHAYNRLLLLHKKDLA